MSDVRSCDARCHGAKGPVCDCWCRGRFHGAAGEQARRDFQEAYGALPAQSDEYERRLRQRQLFAAAGPPQVID